MAKLASKTINHFVPIFGEYVIRYHAKIPKVNVAQENKIRILVCFLACLCIFISVSVKQSYGATALKLGVYAPQDHPWSFAAEKLRDQVLEASKGQIILEIVPMADIQSPKALLSRIRNADIALGIISVFYISDIVDAMRIFKLPFAFRDRVQARIATSGDLAKQLLNELKPHGLVGLEFIPSEYRALVQTSEPIMRPEDFKRLRVATVSDPMIGEAFKALGASPVPLLPTEKSMALTKGLVNALEGYPSFFSKTKLYEVVKFMTILPIHYIPGIIIANPKTWGDMSSDQKTLISREIPAIVKAIDKMLDHKSESAIEMMRQKGVAVSHPEEISLFRRAVLDVYENAADKIPHKYFQVAYNSAYVERYLRVSSRPDKAAVAYRRWGDEDKPYDVYQKPTETDIELEYAVWQIKVEKENYKPQEKFFDPRTNKRWRIDFELQAIK